MEENNWQLIGVRLVRDWHKKKRLEKKCGVSLVSDCDTDYFPIDYFDENYVWDDMDCGFDPMYLNNLRFTIFCLHFYYECYCKAGFDEEKLKDFIKYAKELLTYVEYWDVERSKKIQKLHRKLKYLVKTLKVKIG